MECVLPHMNAQRNWQREQLHSSIKSVEQLLIRTMEPDLLGTGELRNTSYSFLTRKYHELSIPETIFGERAYTMR